MSDERLKAMEGVRKWIADLEGMESAGLVKRDGQSIALLRFALADMERVARIEEGNPKQCKVPPPGWWCSRAAGHEGPCAARPDSEEEDA